MASENVAFDNIPSSIRKPGKYFEFDHTMAMRTLPGNRQEVLIVAQLLAEGSVAQNIPVKIFSDAQAGERFGYGSQVHLMTAAMLKANPYVALTCIGVDDNEAGVAATGTVTVSGAATASGTLRLYVGNAYVETGVAKGDAAADIAADLKTALDNARALPVTGAVATAALTLTAKHKGLGGNDIGLDYAAANDCCSLTVAPMTGGSGDPDISTALAVVFAEQYNKIVVPWTGAEALAALSDHLDDVSGPLEQRPGVGVFGYTGALAAAITASAGLNAGRMVNAYLRGSRSLPMEVGAAMAGVMAAEEDPARPLNTLALDGIHAPDIEYRLSRTEQESLLYNGVTPLEVGPGETVRIVRAVSTYTVDAQGVEDISLLDITSMTTLDYVRKACRSRIALRFPRSKLSDKTAAAVRSELMDVLYKLEQLEIVEAVAEHMDMLIVERDGQDPNRLNANIPADVVNGLHVFAGRIIQLL